MAARGATKMSKSTRVKETARLMYRDHRIASRNLAALAQRKGWTLPPRDAAAAVPTRSAPDLRAFAQGTLPALRHHLTALQALQSS
jgi:predicted outer membrane protein